MAGFVITAYSIYMIIGPGGDGVIFASVTGAIMALAGIQYGQKSQSK